jgi:hypothetical protein
MAELGDTPSGLPLGLPSDVTVKPEALFSFRHERESTLELAVRDEITGVSK